MKKLTRTFLVLSLIIAALTPVITLPFALFGIVVTGFSLMFLSVTGVAFVSACGAITAGIAINCDQPLQGGVVANLYIINFDDIAGVTRNGTNPQIIEAITLNSGKVAYIIEGKNNSLSAKKMLLPGKYDNSYDHEIAGVAFDISPDAKLQLEKMGNGKFVCIVENNYKSDGTTAFEIYGLDAGLYPTAIESDSTNADTQQAYTFTLKTKTDREPHLPATAFKTSYAVTKAWIDALTV